MTGGDQLKSLPAVHGSIVQDPAQHELRVMPAGATVVATYGQSPSTAEQVLASLRNSSATSSPGPAQAAPQRAAGQAPRPAASQAASPATQKPAPQPTTSPAWPGVPSDWPTEIVQPTPPAPSPPKPAPPKPTPPKPSPPKPAPPKPRPAVAGFDTCTAPSVGTMKAWRSAYSVIGVYIGGVNAACDYGNLSASWMRQTSALGWSTLPTYVGPQAPCYGYGTMINPSKAAAQGHAAADNAVGDAQTFGLPKGSPLYYDMEAYNEDDTSCVSAVVNFLSAWTKGLTAKGYVSAVYSSQDSGISDLNSAAKRKVAGFTPPQAVWVALWDGQQNLNGGGLVWPAADRAKQYRGPENRTIGGVTLNIDSDYVGGPTAK